MLAAGTEVGEVVRSATARLGCELLAVVEHTRNRPAVDVRRRAARRAAVAVRRPARLSLGLQLREQQHVANRRRVRQQHREPVDADA